MAIDFLELGGGSKNHDRDQIEPGPCWRFSVGPKNELIANLREMADAIERGDMSVVEKKFEINAPLEDFEVLTFTLKFHAKR